MTSSGAAVPTEDVRTLLADVDALGGFFTITTRPEEAADPAWRPLTTFTGAPVAARIDEVDAQLGGPGRRIAASLLAMSVSARVTGLLLAAGAQHGVVLRLPHDRLHWRPWSGGPMPLWITEPAATRGGGTRDELADDLAEELATVHLAPLVGAVREQVAVSPRVLWGNAASSWAGALRVLITERPAVREPAEALARRVIARGPLAGLGEFVDEPDHPTGLGFVRSTCCLFYRVPGGGTCGDCVLGER